MNFSFGQNSEVTKLQEKLYKQNISQNKRKKIAKKILKIDPFNNGAIDYLVWFYERKNQPDSIHAMFDNLISKYPNNPKSYLITEQKIGKSLEDKIHFLKKAITIDPNNDEVIYKLGLYYYILFIDAYTYDSNKDNPKINDYAQNAFKYLTNLFEKNNQFRDELKYPLTQLSNYLKLKQESEKYENYKPKESYFQIEDFVILPKNWQTDYSTNLYDIKNNKHEVFNPTYIDLSSAIFTVKWYSGILKKMNEPVLRTISASQAFRFVWLRSFHEPVIVRIEKTNKHVTLYWKKGPAEEQKKKITEKEWKSIENDINKINFWKLSTINKKLGLDGAHWILEAKDQNKYHFVDRWNGGEIKNVCLKLLNLTDLKIKKRKIY